MKLGILRPTIKKLRHRPERAQFMLDNDDWVADCPVDVADVIA